MDESPPLKTTEEQIVENARLRADLDEAHRLLAEKTVQLEDAQRSKLAQEAMLKEMQGIIVDLREKFEKFRETHGGSATLSAEVFGQVQVGPPSRPKRDRLSMQGSPSKENALASATAQPPSPTNRKRSRVEVFIEREPSVRLEAYTDLPQYDEQPSLRTARERNTPRPKAAPFEPLAQLSQSTTTAGKATAPSAVAVDKVRVKEEVEDEDPNILSVMLEGPPPKKLKEHDVITLPPDVLAKYLENTPYFEISPPPSDRVVPRKFLRLAYGGSDQSMVQNVAADRNPSGNTKRYLMFPQPGMNPATPTIPGAPGITFAYRGEDDPCYSLFSKANSREARWLYLGEYIREPCGDLAPEHFKAQRHSVKVEWAKWVLDFKSVVDLKARIALWKAGLLPEAREEQEQAIEDQALAMKAGGGLHVSVQDVIDAYESGEKKVGVLRMRCYDYDHAFARDIEERLPTYGDLITKAKKEKEKEKVQEARRKAQQAKGQPAPRRKKPSKPVNVDSDDEHIASESGEDSESEVEIVSTSKRKKGRKEA